MDWSGSMSSKLEKIPNELVMMFMLMVGNILSFLFYKSINMNVPQKFVDETFSSIDKFNNFYDRVFKLMYE